MCEFRWEMELNILHLKIVFLTPSQDFFNALTYLIFPYL